MYVPRAMKKIARKKVDRDIGLVYERHALFEHDILCSFLGNSAMDLNLTPCLVFDLIIS